MIILFQLIVIIAAVFIVLALLGRRTTHSGKAWKKIGIIMLAVGMVVGVLFPELTNVIANAVGVGRGADLLLYATAVAFIGYVLNSYLYQQDQRDALYRLARKVAILEASETYGLKNKK
jgi:hypothetical protein